MAENLEQSENIGMNEFREEIEGVMKESRERGEAHFGGGERSSCDPEDLTREDMEIWRKFKNDDLEREEFEDYRSVIFKKDNESRRVFAAFLGNKMMKKINLEELEDL